MKVSFKLSEASQIVTGSVGEVSDAWFRIRRVFSADTDHAQLVGDKAVRIPLWLFLSRRNALRYRLEVEDFEPQFDARLSKALQRALAQSAEYEGQKKS